MTLNETEPASSGSEADRGNKGDDSVLIEALAQGWSYRLAGERAGLSERSVSRRMDDDEFRARVDERRSERSADRVAELRRADEARLKLSIRAAEVLGEVMDHEDVKTRTGAAKALLPSSPAFDLEARVADLERRAADGDSQGIGGQYEPNQSRASA
jgi:hypothetical protein